MRNHSHTNTPHTHPPPHTNYVVMNNWRLNKRLCSIAMNFLPKEAIEVQIYKNSWYDLHRTFMQLHALMYQMVGTRGVASLTVPAGQEFHFPHFSSNFHNFFIFLKLFSFLSSFWPSGMGKLPTREGPGYATSESMSSNSLSIPVNSLCQQQ